MLITRSERRLNPTFLKSILHVVNARPIEEMIRIHARRVIAFVTDVWIFTEFVPCKNPRDMRRKVHAMLDVDDAITDTVVAPCPKMAIGI